MPLYEYVCKKCKHRFEKIQKFSDRVIKKCPECGGPVERPLTAPAVHFKGSGFYVNDYNARKGGEGDSGGSKRDKDEKKQDTSEKNDKAEKSEDKSKKSSAKKAAEKD